MSDGLPLLGSSFTNTAIQTILLPIQRAAMSRELTPELADWILLLQQEPIDLRELSAADAARALYDFIQTTFGPTPHCFLKSPSESAEAGYEPFWRVMWEDGPSKWGYSLTWYESTMWWFEFELPESHRSREVLLNYQGARKGWYASSYYDFDVCFVDDDVTEPRYVGSIWNE